jgi:hypothetical protein
MSKEITVEQKLGRDKLTIDQNTDGNLLIWQEDMAFFVDKESVPALITALQQLTNN